jgi:hypothetical protein
MTLRSWPLDGGCNAPISSALGRNTIAPTLCLVGMHMGSGRGDTPWVSVVVLGCVSSSVSVVHHAGVPERFRFFIVRTRVPVASAMSPTHVRLGANRLDRSCLWVWAVSASRRGMFVALSVGVDMSCAVVILCPFVWRI